jgi:hypothetical protein
MSSPATLFVFAQVSFFSVLLCSPLRFFSFSSVTWTLDVDFPSPFKEMMQLSSLFSLDFLSLECLSERSNHFTSVLIWSATPLCIVALNAAVFWGRVLRAKVGGRRQLDAVAAREKVAELKATHFKYFLLLSYVVLPPVSLKQFQALDCQHINNAW